MRRVVISLLIMAALILTACGEAFKEGFQEGLQGKPPTPPAHEQPQEQPQQDGQQEQGQDQSQGQDQQQQQAEQPKLPAGVTKAKVVRVIDGDTIEVEYVAGAQLPASEVRLIGVNTPESTTRVEPYGKEASAYTKQQLEGKTVWLEKDGSETDRYDRALRYVWLTEPPEKPTEQDIRTHLFNAVLVLNGYAQVATYPPDVKYVDYFTKFQQEARAKDRGLWALNTSGEPSKKPSSGSSSGSKSTTAKSSSGSSSKKSSGSGSKSSGGTPKTSAKCDPNYSGACVPPYPPDVDCGQLSAKGFRVVGRDVHCLDLNKDGVACESDCSRSGLSTRGGV